MASHQAVLRWSGARRPGRGRGRTRHGPGRGSTLREKGGGDVRVRLGTRPWAHLVDPTLLSAQDAGRPKSFGPDGRSAQGADTAHPEQPAHAAGFNKGGMAREEALELAERTTSTPPMLWHGLLTVPLSSTKGLLQPLALQHSGETCGRRQWHGQETVPQRGRAEFCAKQGSSVPPMAQNLFAATAYYYFTCAVATEFRAKIWEGMGAAPPVPRLAAIHQTEPNARRPLPRRCLTVRCRRLRCVRYRRLLM